MGRKCSHCGNNGHNSRTCATYRGTSSIVGGGLRLFGVQLDIPSTSSSSSSLASMKKSFSMDCFLSSPLAAASSSSSPSPSSSLSSSRVSLEEISERTSLGYLSDNFVVTQSQDRKKGMPWTETEHRAFLIGLETLGKGDWRGISRSFVTTRTPTQVASHAQKYFLRQTSLAKKKQRRSSLFDMSRRPNLMNGLKETHVRQSISHSVTLPIGSSNTAGDRLNNSHTKPSSISFDQNTNLPQEQDHLTTTASAEQNMIRGLDDEETKYDQSSSTRLHHEIPSWLYGLLDSKPERQISLDALVPDLELKLGVVDVPKPLDQNNKPTSDPLLMGSIRVI